LRVSRILKMLAPSCAADLLCTRSNELYRLWRNGVRAGGGHAPLGTQTSPPCGAHMHCSKEVKPQFVPPPVRSRHQGRQVCSLSRLLRCPGCAGLRVPAGANFAPAKLRQKQIVRLNVAGKEESPGRLAEPGALSTGTAWLRDAARPNLVSQVARPKPQRCSRNWNRMAPTKSGRSHPAKMARPWNASAPSGNAHHAQHFNREALAAQPVQTAMNSSRSLYIERSRSARIGQHRNVKWGSVLTSVQPPTRDRTKAARITLRGDGAAVWPPVRNHRLRSACSFCP
jgi:hypothetical protein